MSRFDAFKYDGKRVVVIGAATGMGAATAELVRDAGAEVVAMDIAPCTLSGVKEIRINLADRSSIDEALGQCGGPIHALFLCAGVADGTPGIEKINFIGHRHVIDTLIANGHLGRGASIGFISSAAGLGWETALTEIKEYLATPDYDSAAAWIAENGHADYLWSKQAICTYVAMQAFPLMKQGIRINAICPGPTDTPLAQANKDMWLGFGADYRGDVGIDASTPMEQAYPLVFLCSDAGAAITGQTIISDAGYLISGLVETYPAASGAAQFLLGRMG
ncbi:MAG TPA: SDR family oxidoreductase [Acidimicrobiales bacterium]|nr:SDR family oxidoreductase [Acidimicrobiales bacterium]